MPTPTKRSKRPQAPLPSRSDASRRPPLWVYLAAGAGIVLVGAAIVLLANGGGNSERAAPATLVGAGDSLSSRTATR